MKAFSGLHVGWAFSDRWGFVEQGGAIQGTNRKHVHLLQAVWLRFHIFTCTPTSGENTTCPMFCSKVMLEWTECLEGRNRQHHCYQGSHQSLLLCSSCKAGCQTWGTGELVPASEATLWTICQWRQATVPSGSFSKAVKAAPGSHFRLFLVSWPLPFISSPCPTPPPSCSSWVVAVSPVALLRSPHSQ